MPVVFRLASALLLVVIVVGQVWHRQPAGPVTRAVLATVARYCPSAASPDRHPSIAAGARALDRTGWRLLADRYAPRPASRCGG